MDADNDEAGLPAKLASDESNQAQEVPLLQESQSPSVKDDLPSSDSVIGSERLVSPTVADKEDEDDSAIGSSEVNKSAAGLKVDLWSTRLASWSQVVMVMVVVWGYFYTVKPVFQNQLLGEKAAKLELDNDVAKTRLADTLKKRADAFAQLASLNVQLARASQDQASLKAEYDSMVAQVGIARESASKAELRAKETELKRAAIEKGLVQSQWQLLLNDFAFSVPFVRSYNDTAYVFDLKLDGSGFEDAAKTWPDPYEILEETAISLASKAKTYKQYPAEMADEVLTYANRLKSSLTCDQVDLGAIKRSYTQEIAALTPAIDKEVEDQISKVRREAADANHKVLITDEFYAQTKNMITLGKKFQVESAFRMKLLDLRRACIRRVEIVSEAIRKDKLGGLEPAAD